MRFIINILHNTVTKVILSIILVLFLVSLFVFWGWYVIQFNKIIGYYYVHKGDKAYKKSEYQKAIDLYNKGLKYYPGHSRASCNLGNIYVAFENYYDAANAYQNALKYSPNYITCRMDLGIILSEQMANYDQAIQEYGKAINAKPFVISIPFIFDNKKSIETNKGIAYYDMGLAYRGKAIYIGENTYIASKYLQKAKEAYKNAKKILKNDFDTHYNLALTNHLLGDYKNAGIEYCNAIDIRPMSFESHYNLALLLITMKLDKEALSELEKTLMLVDYKGDEKKRQYIFETMANVKRRLINNNDYKYLIEKNDLTADEPDQLIYVNGKIKLPKDDKNAFVKLLRTCPYKNQFEEI